MYDGRISLDTNQCSEFTRFQTKGAGLGFPKCSKCNYV
jgi:hypothetical protein